jgi:ABC-type multidrug transport system fused ATPase/permease subunit
VSAYTSIGNSLDGRAASSSYFSGAAAGTDQSMVYEKATASRSNTQRLVDRARPHGWYLAGGCLALLIRLPFSLSLPHFVSETIGGLMDKDEATVRFNITCFIACGCVDAFLDFWCVFVFGYVQHRIIRALRVDLYRSLLGQEIAFFEEMSSGELTSRLTADTSEMANDLTWVFRFTIESLVRIGGIATYMFVRSWRLAAMACCIIPVIAFLNRLYGKWMSKNAQKVRALNLGFFSSAAHVHAEKQEPLDDE